MRLGIDREKLLSGWARLVTGHPLVVLALGLSLALIAGVYAATSLGFRSDRSQLIDPDLDWQQRYAEFKRRFPRWDDAIVVLGRADDEPVTEAAAVAFFDALDDLLGADEAFGARTLLIDPDEASANALLLEPTPVVVETVEQLRRARELLAQPIGLDAALLGAAFRPDAAAELAVLVEGVEAVILGEATSVLRHGQPERVAIRSTSQRFVIGFVSLDENMSGDDASVNADAARIAALRGHVRTALEATRGAVGDADELEAGVTGVPVLESDETAQSTVDATRSSALSLTLIAVLLIAVYRGVSVPLLALAALLTGVAWSFGWVTLAVGHLQVLSVVFAVFLLGLGVDTAIHLIARLELVHPDHEHMPEAVERAFQGVGAGVMTGALTTAAAFGATALSHFAGVAEMGLIAAGGVLLCTVAVMSLFPAALEVIPKPERRLRARKGGAGKPFGGAVGIAMDGRPWLVLGVSVVVVAVAGFLALGVRYDSNLLNLMPPSAESVVWERRLTADDERSSWHAVVVAEGADEAERLTRALRASALVSEVGGAGVIFPPTDEMDVRRHAARSLDRVPTPSAEAPEGAGARIREALRTIAPAELAVSGRAQTLLDAASDEQWTRVAEAFARDRRALARQINALDAAMTPRASDLPSAAGELFLAAPSEADARNGYILRVYPAGNGGLSPLHPDRLGPFVEEVLSIAPSATGPAVQIHKSTAVILSGYRWAAVYAALAIVLILLWDFRSVGDALCALLPVGVAVVLLLGVMGAMGWSLNFANTIVMPLLIGLGVDAGVHAVHRWRAQPMDPPAGLAGGCGRAITLTTWTTAIGFGAMAIAEHRGVRSLGLVMATGLVLVWVSAIVVLPAVLRLRTTPAMAIPERGPVE